MNLNILENTPVLETPRLLLRPFALTDAPALLPILADEVVNTFLPWFPLKTLSEAEDFLRERFLTTYGLPSAYRYAICLRDSDRPERGGPLIGYLNLSTDESHDLGYGLARAHWGRGYAAEAGAALLPRLRAAGYDYITATHDVENPKSGAVMKKLGMHYCYTYRERVQPKDVSVLFRMYQLNLDGDPERVYRHYWERYPEHFVETL